MAAAEEPRWLRTMELGLVAEVLSDASGAIHLANEAGTTEEWTAAVTAGAVLPKSDLGTSAIQGRAAFAG